MILLKIYLGIYYDHSVSNHLFLCKWKIKNFVLVCLLVEILFMPICSQATYSLMQSNKG
jgi:hypothetical protein